MNHKMNMLGKLSDLKELTVRRLSFAELAKLLAGAGLTYLLYKSLRLYLHRRKYDHIPGPPTQGWLSGFFFGHILEVKEAIEQGRIFPDKLVDWERNHGETFKFYFMDKVLLYTSNKEAIRDILIVNNFPKTDIVQQNVGFPYGERALGVGLLTETNNTRWKHRRTVFNPGFYRNILMTFVGQFNQKADNLMDRLRTMADGKTSIRLFDELNSVTLDAIAQIAFGMDIDSVGGNDKWFGLNIAKLLPAAALLFNDPFVKINPFKRSIIKDMKTSVRMLRGVGREKIEERIRAMQNNEPLPNDILSSILTTCKDDDLDLESMVDDFITFFIAGQETTANALAFTFLELARHPEVLEKLREEIDHVLGERSEITYADLGELKYFSFVFKETLRLWPTVPQIERLITEPMRIGDINVPKNTPIFLSTYANARNSKFFKDPYEFRPERFAKDADSMDTNIENYTYFPFSLGPRNCIGQSFAQFEGIVMIAKLVQRFDFKLDPNQPMTVNNDITMRPSGGAKVFLTIRS